MMWVELWRDLKERLAKYHEKLNEQPIRSVSRMCNACFWFSFFFINLYVTINNKLNLPIFSIMMMVVFALRYFHVLFATTNKNIKKIGLMILMAIIEFALLFIGFRNFKVFLLIGLLVMILLSFPFIFGNLGKKL